MIKTNAMRILDKNKIAYEVMEYDTSDGAIDGISVAKKAGLDANMVFKTLVTQSSDREFIVFVVPVGGELDLKKAAKAAGVKSVSMIPQKLLLPNTGYIHGGCSPVGMNRLFRTFFDITAVNQQKIAVSAGKVGEQMILSPDDLKLVTKGTFAALTRD